MQAFSQARVAEGAYVPRAPGGSSLSTRAFLLSDAIWAVHGSLRLSPRGLVGLAKLVTSPSRSISQTFAAGSCVRTYVRS